MKQIVMLAGIFAAAPAWAQDCTYPQREPVQREGRAEYRFTDSCGNPYEVGYRLEGTTLHFPRGGQHSLSQASEGEAEQILRETYGLVGERNKLIRTKGL